MKKDCFWMVFLSLTLTLKLQDPVVYANAV